MKDGQFDYDTTIQKIDIMPTEMQGPLRIAFDHCKDEGKRTTLYLFII